MNDESQGSGKREEIYVSMRGVMKSERTRLAFNVCVYAKLSHKFGILETHKSEDDMVSRGM
jgi:hypothetical protein